MLFYSSFFYFFFAFLRCAAVIPSAGAGDSWASGAGDSLTGGGFDLTYAALALTG